MRATLSSTFVLLFLFLFNGIANAYITLYSWPTLAYTGKTYNIAWSGDGTTVTVSLLLGGSSTTLTNLGTIWTGTGSSIYWTVGTALKASDYYVIKVSQSGYTDYSDYFTLLESSSGTNLASSSTIKGTGLSSTQSVYTSISTQISSVPTTVTKVSTVIPTSASSDNSPFTFDGSSDDSSISSLYPTALSTISVSMTSFATFTPSSCASPTTTNLSSDGSGCQGSHLSHTTMIGIIVGAIIVIVAILGGIILLVRRSRNRQNAVQIPEKNEILSPASTYSSAASGPNPDLNPSAAGAHVSGPNYQQQQQPPPNPGPGLNMYDQQFPNQYKQQQQYQQSHQPYQHHLQTYQQAYQQYQYQPYQHQQQQQQQQEQTYPPQQYPPSQAHPQAQAYNQILPPPLESHELTAMQDTKRPANAAAVNSPTSAISPATTYSNLQTDGPGTSISDRASEMDTTILPRYEKDAPIASVQAIQPDQHQQQQQYHDGRLPLQSQRQGHGPVYELG